MTRRHLVLGAIAALLAVGGIVRIWMALGAREYHPPIYSSQQEPVPRDQGLAEIAQAAKDAAEAKKYEPPAYRAFPFAPSRVLVWIAAELHLMFAAFVLAVPIFAFILELIGYLGGDKRYDRLAYEFTKLLSTAFSFTASFGGLLTFLLIILYPAFTNYLMQIFSPTFLPYALLFFCEAGFLYSYYYGWGKFPPLVHLGLGLGINVVGTLIMMIANAWASFMMTPQGVSPGGALIDLYAAFDNYSWMPINIHRFIGNVAFGGSIAAAYAAWKFLHATSDEERAHFDWMGYIGNFVAISAFLPLPFAGYYLAKEIYAYNQALGIMMMGGAFSWLFIIQAVLIGNLFLAANYYLWLGMGRIAGTQAYQKYVKYLLATITICFAVWATPHSMVATATEIRNMGGTLHPILGYLGVMSAKNTAVNVLILTTYVSFLFYRRTGKRPSVSWARIGNLAQFAIFAVATGIVIFYGVYGYFVEAAVRIGFSVPQVLAVLVAMVAMTAIDIPLMRGAEATGETHWGRVPASSQYCLIFIAVTFTWLMGLMGYVRSGLRSHWHVYGVMADTSVDAFTPTLGYATQIISLCVLLYFALIAVVFWLASLHDQPDWGTGPSSDETPAPHAHQKVPASS